MKRLREIARAGEGSMRDAQSAFDQVISFAGTKIKTEDVETALGTRRRRRARPRDAAASPKTSRPKRWRLSTTS